MLTFKDFLEVHSRSQSSCRYVEQCKNSDISQCGCYDDYMQEHPPGNLEMGITTSLWRIIWDISEFTGIGLGRFAPFVFGKMIGAKGRKIR